MWAVQAITDPPQVAYGMQHGQVVMSRRKTVGDSDVTLPAAEAIGQPNTVQLRSSGKPAAIDPWTLSDPGQSALPSDGGHTGIPQAKAQLEELEQRLEKTILARLPVNMAVDSQEHRWQQLEQMSTMVNRQQSIEHAAQETQAQRINYRFR